MSIVIWLLAGGLVGWLASRYMTSTHVEAMAFNVVVGVFGAAFVGWAVAPMLGVPPGLGMPAFFVSALGAAILLFCVHFVQKMAAH